MRGHFWCLCKPASGLLLQCQAVGSRGTLEKFEIVFEGNKRGPKRWKREWGML